MKYFLWLDSHKVGPHEEAHIRELLESGAISLDTLAIPEGSDGTWEPLSALLEMHPPPEPSEDPEPKLTEAQPETEKATSPPFGDTSTIRDEISFARASQTRTNDVQQPIISYLLYVLGFLELIGGSIAGGILASKSSTQNFGWSIILAGVFGCFVLIGFAKLIQYSHESAQRLRQIELCIKRDQEDRERLRQIDLAIEKEKKNPDTSSPD